MNQNWDSLIRAIVPLSFMAIWALTSLFNRDSKPKPSPMSAPRRPINPGPGSGPLASEPTLRWSSTTGPGSTSSSAKRPPVRVGGDDGIVILSSDTRTRAERLVAGQFSTGNGAKRPNKGKPVVPQRKPEPTQTRTKLAGVSQNVNQHLTNSTIEMPPLVSMPPMASMSPLGLNSLPTAAPDSIGVIPLSVTARALADPVRLREAFVLNEILLPPVSMRNRPIGPAAQ